MSVRARRKMDLILDLTQERNAAIHLSTLETTKRSMELKNKSYLHNSVLTT